MNILVLGASFTGEYLADHFPDHQVWFLSRRSADLIRAGRRVYPVNGAGDAGQPLRFDAIMDTVPAIAAGSENENPNAILDPPYMPAVLSLLERDPGLPFIHISSTSVLPGSARDGGTVRATDATDGSAGSATADSTRPAAFDETTPVGPENSRGMRRLNLERRIRELVPAAAILRSTGIYGPGRSIALQFREGNFRRTASGNVYVSRIHVHDLVRLCLAMATRLRANPNDAAVRLVHAVDEKPTANREVFSFLETELGLAVPGDWRDQPAQGRVVRSLYARDLLGGRYRYPTYIEGFRACLAGEG
ncbi:MAG: hypothetical protein NXI24_12695 [bacterium]|nr:hypothetical protein [bacterium]